MSLTVYQESVLMGLELFFRNMKYLFRYNLKGMYQHASAEHDDALMTNVLTVQRNLAQLKEGVGGPKVMDAWETLDYLLETKASFCRLGDGELAVAYEKKGNLFQNYDEHLAAKLRDTITSSDPKILVGINYYWYHEPKHLHDRQMLFYLVDSERYRNLLAPYCGADKTFGDSTITMPYMLYKELDFKRYYGKLEQLWKDQDIVLICGKTIFNKLNSNIFESAKSIEYIYGPRVNAFDKYDELLQKALATDPNKTKFIIMGQTATVLAYDLAKHGHRAIDMGHTAKDYDAYLKQAPVDNKSIMNFFDKD